jgi:hypothetical protein
MPRPYVTAAEHRRKANRAIAMFLVILVTAVLSTWLLYHPERANAYVHVSACKQSLRGGGGSDNDVHNAAVSSRATGFVGWASGYTRTGANSVYVRGLLTYPGGRYLWWQGRCYSHDYGPDWFS